MLEQQPADLEALLALKLPGGETVEERRRALIAKIGENLSVRRFVVVRSAGALGAYLHRHPHRVAGRAGRRRCCGSRATSRCTWRRATRSTCRTPRCPRTKWRGERAILTEQAAQDPKNANKTEQVLAQISEGKLRKSLAEITRTGSCSSKDDKQTVEKLLKSANAKVSRFERYEVGAGIEKKQEDFVAEVMKQAGHDNKH